MSERLLWMIALTEKHSPKTEAGGSGGPEQRRTGERSSSGEVTSTIPMAQPDHKGFDEVLAYVIAHESEELRKKGRQAEADQVRNVQFTKNGLDWYEDLRFKLETNEAGILESFKQLSEIKVDDEEKIRLNSLERGVLQAAGQFQIRRYAARVLHDLTVEDTANGHSIESRIKELDRLLGPTFQHSDVRRHYEFARLGINLWRFASEAAGNLAHKIETSDIPHIETVKGTTLTWADVLYMDDVHGWYQGGFKDKNWDKRKQRLVDVMARLDKSDDDILKIDRRSGRDLQEVGPNRYAYVDGPLKGTVVPQEFVGTAWLTRDTTRKAVEMVDAQGTYYVYQDKLQEGSTRRIGVRPDYTDYYVDKQDLVDVYNRGRTYEEKIREGKEHLSELEVLAIRIADGVGEHIHLSDAEQKRIYEKTQSVYPALPKTPKEDRATTWGIRHKGIWTTFMTRSKFAADKIYGDLPDTVFYTNQPQSVSNYRLRKDDGSYVTITLRPDKRGTYTALVGTNWSTLASMTRSEFERFARDEKSQYPYLVYERAASQEQLIVAIENRVRDHGKLTIEDVSAMTGEGGAINKYSPLGVERVEMALRLGRDTTVTEVRQLQGQTDTGVAAKETLKKVRAGLAREEFVAWKMMALRIPETRTLFSIKGEERARMLMNEVWTADEAIINDAIVGYDEWNKAVQPRYKESRNGQRAELGKPFLGGVAFEQWLLSNKLFKEKEVTLEDFYKWSGVEIYYDKYTVMRSRAESSGKIVREPVTMLRRRLRVIGQATKPNVAQNHPDYARQAREYNRWVRYAQDEHHGIGAVKANKLKKWMNAEWPPIVAADYDKADVLPMMPEATDLLRDKYKVLGWALEWFYPNREWRSEAVRRFARMANRRRSPDELGRPDFEERIKTRTLLSSDKAYRWGWLPNRQPLHMWRAFTEMNNGTRFEFAPDTKYLAQIAVDRNGNSRPITDRQPGDLVLYRVASPTYIDRVLQAREIHKPGYVTLETLQTMPRRFSNSLEAIEYGGGRFIPLKGASFGTRRRPMELNKHALQLKIPWIMVERSFAYVRDSLYQDVVSGMGSRYKKGDPKSEELARNLMRDKFDREKWSTRIGTIVDSFFMYQSLKEEKVLSEDDFEALLTLSGSWFQFYIEGTETRPNGLQGGNFIELLDKLGVKDPQLKQFMERRDEETKKRIKDLARLGGYLAHRHTLGVDYLLDWFTELPTKTAATAWRQLQTPAVGGGTSILAGSAILELMASRAAADVVPLLHWVAQRGMYGGGLLAVLGYAWYKTHKIGNKNESPGKMVGTKYVPARNMNAESKYASIAAHEGGWAAYDYPGDDIIKAAATLNKELKAALTDEWMKRYAGAPAA